MGERSPVWQSEEWQEVRRKLLLDTCQQCGSDTKLSLVHLWKPPKYGMIRAKVESEIISRLLEKEQIDPFDPISCGADTEREACPSCQSVNLRQRKTKLPPFKCGRCGEEFSKPIQVMVRDDYLFNQNYKLWKTPILVPYEDEIEQKVRKLQQDYDTKYRSGEGTTTYCQKCAFLFTQKGMILCQSCKTKYHRRRYDQCFECHTSDQPVLCEKCGITELQPQPGGINICENCYEKMWKELTE